MGFVEVLQGGAHLGHHRSCIGQVHAPDVVALEDVDEALGHTIALGTAYGRVDRPQARLSGDLPRLGGDVGATVVREELQSVSLRNALDVTKALFHRLNEHLAHRLAWQAFACPRPVSQDLAIAAVFREGRRHGLTRIALDLEAVRASAHVAPRDCDLPFMRPTGLASSGCLGQQQRMAGHHAVNALGVDPRHAGVAPLTIDQRSGTAVAIGRQFGDLGLDLVEQHGVVGRSGCRSNPRCEHAAAEHSSAPTPGLRRRPSQAVPAQQG